MPRTNVNPRRSGRFNNASGSAVKIIGPSASLRIYRFHNTSKRRTLSITVGSASAVSLVNGNSIDLAVRAGDAVTVGDGQGVYDLLRGNEDVRSGLFKGAVQIAQLGGQSRLYRVINGGDAEITILTESIAAGSSLDLVLTGDVSVAGANPEGVFDLLGNT